MKGRACGRTPEPLHHGWWHPPGDGARAMNSDVPPTVGWSQKPPRGATEDMHPRNRGPARSLRHRALARTQVGGRVAAHRRSHGSRSRGFLDGCYSGMSVTQEESFSPVLTVETFTDEHEAVRQANDAVALASDSTNTRNREHLAEHQSTARTLVPGITPAPPHSDRPTVQEVRRFRWPSTQKARPQR